MSYVTFAGYCYYDIDSLQCRDASALSAESHKGLTKRYATFCYYDIVPYCYSVVNTLNDKKQNF